MKVLARMLPEAQAMSNLEDWSCAFVCHVIDSAPGCQKLCMSNISSFSCQIVRSSLTFLWQLVL